MKTLLLSLVFSLMVFLPSYSNASGTPAEPDTLTTSPTDDPAAVEDELEIILDASIWFQEKVYLHIYDENDQPIIEGAYSRKELNENKELQSLLRKSTRFLSVDRHYYYYVGKEI